MKIKKHKLKKFIKQYLFEEKKEGLDSDYAIVCYSDSDFAGKAAAALLSKAGAEIELDDNRNPKGWLTGKIPQGHAWLVLVNKNGSTCVCEFGSESCDYSDTDDIIDTAMIFLAKNGIPFCSKTKIRNRFMSDIKGDKLTVDIVDKLVKESLTTNRSVNKKVYKINSFDKAYRAAGTDGECRPYNLLPFDLIPALVKNAARAAGYSLESLRFNNCGSYVANVLGEGIGMSKLADSVDIATMPGLIIEIFDTHIPAKFKTKIVNDEYS